MTEVQKPTVCPKCKSKNIAEKSENVFETVWYKWSGEMGLYTRVAADSEAYGDSYLECAACGHRFDKEVYNNWLEHQ